MAKRRGAVGKQAETGHARTDSGDPVRRRHEALEELYENNCARAEGLIWDTKTGRELPFPPVNDALLAVREAVWWLDRELRARR